MKSRGKSVALALLIVLVMCSSFFLICTIFSNQAPGQPRVTEKPIASHSHRSGMVASAHPLASRVGIEILKRGGNAVDAAVATAFALGVVEPFASGIGGGGFMLIYPGKNKEVITIDYRERAPLAARAGMYPSSGGQWTGDRMKEGLLAVAVPGTVAGLTLALSRYGTMDLKTVMAPSIEIAEKGYKVSKLLNSMMATNSQKLLKFPVSARIYLKNGRPYRVGDSLSLKDLAGVYRLIMENGPDVFYKGALAERIEKQMKSGGGLITKEDLAAYQPVLRPPVRGNHQGYDIFSMGPPSSGGTCIIELLNILGSHDIAGLGFDSPESISLMAEAMKEVFSDRAKFMGDPDFTKVPLDTLLSREHARSLSSHLSNQTSHLSVADSEENMVALTQTINSFFGSGVVVPGTGILLNDEMNDFDPGENGPNSIKPGKRPLSSMSPTLVLKDGRPYLTIGTPGATRIITALTQVLMNLIDHKMTIQKAIDAPRIHCEGDKEIFMESRIPKKVRDVLTHRGYRLIIKEDFDLYFGGVQAVRIDPKTGTLQGAADPRREGSAIGFSD